MGMTKREIRRWIKGRIANELRLRLTEVPTYVSESADPDAVTAAWSDEVLEIAERLSPET
jgi:hypothetical protein